MMEADESCTPNIVEDNYTIDNQPPVLYLAIRQWSGDLKHLIPIPEHPDYRVSINFKIFP